MDLIAERIEHAEEVSGFEPEDNVGLGDRRLASLRVVQRMLRREVHAAVLGDHRSLQQFGQLDQMLQPRRRASHLVCDEKRVGGRDEQSGQFGDRARIALGRGRQRQLRHAERRSVRHGALLQLRVRDDDDRAVRRSHRDVVRSDHRLPEVRQRDRRVIPLDVVSHHRGGILNAVQPLEAWLPHCRIESVAEHDVDWHAITIRVVDGHRRVLQADGAVCEDSDRLPLDLEVAVRHRHRRFLVAARDHLRTRVAAVVDDRFVQAAEGRSGIRTDVLDAERFEDVEHVIGAARPLRQETGFWLSGVLCRRRGSGDRTLGSFGGHGGDCGRRGQRRRPGDGALDESATIYGAVGGFGHCSKPPSTRCRNARLASGGCQANQRDSTDNDIREPRDHGVHRVPFPPGRSCVSVSA